jgi:hypothetical protein
MQPGEAGRSSRFFCVSGEPSTDPKNNRDRSSTHRESQHNKSEGAHRAQPGQREDRQTEQKKRFSQPK